LPDNDEIFLHAATTNHEFRRALRTKDRAYLSRALDDLGITVENKAAVIEAILEIDWHHLSGLEDRLNAGKIHPDN
jgi:hypothetical protein